ncbi:MAG TPA: exo-alpha-sialidase [Fimbriiglobus sp.]|jgi:sialidase-1|nr:exo-alpha-sialidase [Fimbriiglobus sp.]
MTRPTALLLLVLLAAPLRAADPPAAVPLEPPLRERCLTILRDGLKSDEFWPAMHAAEALTLAGQNQDALAALAMRSETDDQKRCGLAREAIRAGDRTKLPILFSILDKAGSIGHTHAAESLFKVAEVGDGTKLRAALAQDDNPRLKMMAAAALARCGHTTALDTVRKRLTDPDVELRKVAVWVLGQLGSKSDVEPIRAGLAKETDPLAKAYVANALATLGDAEGKKLLGQNLTSSDPAVKTYAADFAGHARAVEFRDTLVKLLDDPTLDVRVRAAQSLVAFSLPPPDAGAIITNDVYRATDKNPRYSEGSIALLTDGTLLYATTEFTGGAADESRARVVARDSRDGGRTWGEPRVLQENIGKQNVMSVTFRRMKPNAMDGPLGLFYLVKNGPADLKLFLRVSTDEGKTFGEPVCTTNGPGYHVVNNDRVTVLSTGRIVVPVAWDDDISRKGGMHFECFCTYSDDLGKTWKKGAGTIDLPKRGAMEPEVVELAGGRLLMIIRTQLGHIATAYSADGGHTWGEPGRLPVTAPESPATIRRVPATGDLLLVWNNTHKAGAGHGGRRSPLTAAVSSDEGKTWHHLRDVETRADQTYAYTSILFVKDRVLLTYYITDPKDQRWSSRFRSLPVSWLYAK